MKLFYEKVRGGKRTLRCEIESLTIMDFGDGIKISMDMKDGTGNGSLRSVTTPLIYVAGGGNERR